AGYGRRPEGLMLSILVSVLVALVVGFGLYPVFWTWYAPIIPAVLAGCLTFYVLFTQMTKRVQAQLEPLGALLQNRQLEQAEAVMDGVQRKWGMWVLLLNQQVSAQKGVLRYAQMKFDDAKPLLDKGKWNNWQAHAMLGAIAHREGDHAKCWDHLDKAAKASAKEPMVYILHAVLAVRTDDRDRAMTALSTGMEKAPASNALKALHKTIANKKRIQTKKLPESWFHFFPEDLMKQMMVRGRKGGPPKLPEGVQQRFAQAPFPQPKGGSKKMRRG
ncbi:MAG: tetratricopeptide repeat protein, partial [Myxococcota bacterium]